MPPLTHQILSPAKPSSRRLFALLRHCCLPRSTRGALFCTRAQKSERHLLFFQLFARSLQKHGGWGALQRPSHFGTRTKAAPLLRSDLVPLGHGDWRRLATGGFSMAEVRQERGEDADGGEERAKVIDEVDTIPVGQLAQEGCSDSPQTESEPEKEPGDHADSSGNQILGVDQNRGKRRSQNQADDDGENGGPEQIDVRQEQAERQNAQNRDPDYVAAADAVAHRPADDGSGSHGSEKNEEMNLCVLRGDMEFVDQIKDVVADQAGQIEVFREHERDEDRQIEAHFSRRQRRMRWSI